MQKCYGLRMELNDCSFPLINKIVHTDRQDVGFKDADFVFLIGSKPRGLGMQRKDLLLENGKIFV